MGAPTELSGPKFFTDAGTREPGLSSTLRAAMAALHEVVSFTNAALLPVDPMTLLPIAGLVEGISADTCEDFWRSEYSETGVNKFTDLARADDPVRTLVQATDGQAQQARRYLDIFAPVHFHDELRVAFRVGGQCRGFAHILRSEPFAAEEIARVRDLVRPIAAMLQRCAAAQAEPGIGSGIVMLDRDGTVVHATLDARRLLDEVCSDPLFDATRSERIPGLLAGLVAQARAATSGQVVSTRVRGAAGSWFRASAARTEIDDVVALIIEPARPTDLIPVAMESLGLTPREVCIVEHLSRGLADKEIATDLGLSLHTVRDHVKAVLGKCGVNSRGEVVARIFVDYVQPALEREVLHGP